ncbi:hypothetical protein RND81_01G208500 [Saponaria officinalis]|uniref:Uncharacterized protein n=1 Tax=Saponaria officinalis TaxID=3572 RepID=A0AAW1NBD6_SAPOF
MGNCSFKIGNNSSILLDDNHETSQQKMIKVVTTTGGIMELYAPITADQITSEFPDHGLFLSQDVSVSSPLHRKDHLHPGHLYYLLPLSSTKPVSNKATKLLSTPYRMSFDTPKVTYRRRSSAGWSADVAPPYNNNYNKKRASGVWKVRLIINPEQLSEILSQEARTEELIESVRIVAKCGTTGSSVAPSDNNSEHGSSSVSSSWKPSL